MILEIPPYAPDVSDYEARGTLTLLNVLPRSDGYGPFQDFQALTTPIAFSDTFPGAITDTSTKILLHGEGADGGTVITDSNTGGAAHTWTAVGNANTDNAQFKFGLTSLALDGTGDYVTTPDHADFTLGSSDFTAECWFNRSGGNGTFRWLFGQGDILAAISARSFGVLLTTTNTLRAEAFVGLVTFTVDGTTTFTAAGWHHVAFVRTGNILKLFVDGVQEGGNVAIAGSINDAATVFGVGISGGTAATNSHFGWIDEFRLSVGIARWTADFTPPAAPYQTQTICRGYFYARNADGSITVFAGTATKLYKLNNTTLGWVDVSKAGDYTAVPTADQWQFAQFNNFVFAVQIGTVPQVFDLTSSTAFADLAGSPPQARYIAVVNRFLVLSGLTSTTPYRVQWSGFNATTTWTAGVNQSDTYDMPDGGIVRSIAGGEYGIITQDSTIRRMVYSPGSPVVFQFDRISEEKGIFAPLSMVRGGDRVFFYGNDGFQMVPPGQYPQPIGKERVDRFFARTADLNAPQYIIGAADPRAGRVFWAFRSTGSSVSAFDRLLCYDYVIDKWSLVAMNGEYITTLAAPGITLESLDSISGSIDALTFSLDDVSTSTLARLSIFNTSHILGFFSGANLEATLVTSEKSGEGRRLRVRGFRPVTDAENVYGSVSGRETLNNVANFSTETLINQYGVCPANVSARNARGKLRVPAGEVWTYVTGIEPDVAIEGRR